MLNKKLLLEKIDLRGDRIGITGRAFQEGKPQIVENVTRDPDYLPSLPSTKSELAVPIIFKGMKLGVINVEHPKLNAFNAEDQSVLELFANQAAIAIHNGQLFEQLTKRTKLLSSASKLTRDTTSLVEPQELMNKAVREISERFGYYHAGIFLLDADHVKLVAASSPGGAKMLERCHNLALGEGIVGKVALTGRRHFAQNVASDADHLPNLDLPDTKGEIAFPLKVKDKVLGVLDLQSLQQMQLSDEEINTLQIMVDQLSNALKSARLNQGLLDRNKELKILYDAGKDMISTSSMSNILIQIAHHAFNLINESNNKARYCVVGLKKGDALRLEATFPPETLVRLHQKIGTEIDLTNTTDRLSLSGYTALSGETMNIPDVNEHSDYIEFDPYTKSELVVPIKYGDEVLGIINVEQPERAAFTEQDEQNLELLAAQAAIALNMIHMKGVIGRHTAVKWMEMVSRTWGHSINREVGLAKRHIAKLQRHLAWDDPKEEIRQRLDNLASVVSQIGDIPITAPLVDEQVTSIDIHEFLTNHLKSFMDTRTV